MIISYEDNYYVGTVEISHKDYSKALVYPLKALYFITLFTDISKWDLIRENVILISIRLS